MSEDPEDISPRERHRAKRGGDPEGRSPEGDAKDDSPSENHRAKRGGEPTGRSPVGDPEGRSPKGEPTGRSPVDDPEARWESLLARAGCDRSVIAHARAVTSVALSFTGNPLADRELVRAGAMLHDIGRGVTHGISHAQRGADIARSYGLDPRIVSIIERHIGAGLTADECSLERLLPRDCVPVTLEEKIVANADNLVHGKREAGIGDTLAGAIRLKKRVRHRIYRLYLEMEAFRG